MVAKTAHNWEDIFYRLCKLVRIDGVKPTFKGLARELELPYTTLRNGLQKHYNIYNNKDLDRVIDIFFERQVEPIEEAVLTFVDKKEAEDVDWREFVDLAKTTQDLEARTSPRQKWATIKIATKRPVAIMFTSDWHLGEQYSDHDQWAQDIEFVLETPDLFLVDLGDDRQNARSFRNLSTVLSQILSPKQQALMLRSVVQELTKSDKLLAKIGGNHDVEWDERIFGEALQKFLLEHLKAPTFANRGLIKLQVGSTQYTMLLFHKSRFKSFLRRTHGAMREHQLSIPADIVAGGHDHEPGMEHLYNYTLAKDAGLGFGGETLFIKTGTYSESAYGWKYFHSGGFPQNYTVVLFPEGKRMVPFTNPRDAVRFLDTF